MYPCELNRLWASLRLCRIANVVVCGALKSPKKSGEPTIPVTGNRCVRMVVHEVKLNQGFATVRMQIPEAAVTQAHHSLRLLWLSPPGRHGYDYRRLLCFQHAHCQEE